MEIHSSSQELAIGGQKTDPPVSALDKVSEALVWDAFLPVNYYTAYKLKEDARTSCQISGPKPPTDEKLAVQKQLKDDLSFADSAKSFQHESARLLKGGMETATLFMRGKTGWAGAVIVYALDEWRPVLPLNQQLCDLALGAAKGAGMKAVFSRVGELDPTMKLIPTQLNLPLRATILGASTRTISTALTRSTWQDETGRFDCAHGGLTIAGNVANPLAVCTDIATFGFSFGLQQSLNKATQGAIGRSPLLSTVLLGTGFGFSGGAAQEALREHSAHEKIDLGKVASNGLIHAAVDSVAAVPGGMQAEREALAIYSQLGIGKTVGKIPELQRTSSGDENTSVLREQPDKHASNCESIRYQQALDPPQSLSIILPREPQLAEKSELLGTPVSRKEEVVKPDRFGRNVAKMESVDVYNPRGMKCEVAVPHRYNIKLDRIRAYRSGFQPAASLSTSAKTNTASHSLSARAAATEALPEDIAGLLKDMPNNSIIERANVFNHFLDADPNILASAQEHTINFFKQRYDCNLRNTANHEWAHVLHNRKPELLNLYRSAVVAEEAFEKPEANSRPYACKNVNENWAVHMGEEVLTPDPSGMLKMADYAPIRLAVLGKALDASLNQGEQAQTSTYKRQYQARADFIAEKVIPIALKTLRKKISTADRLMPDHFDLLSSWSAKKSDVKTLIAAYPKIYSEHACEALLNCGMKLLDGNEKAKFNFLYKLAYSDHSPAFPIPRFTEPRALGSLAVEKMSPEMINKYFMPKMEKVRTQSDNPSLLADHLQDLSSWLLKNDSDAIYNGRIEQLLHEALKIRTDLAPNTRQQMLCRASLVRLYQLQGDFGKAISSLTSLRDEYENGTARDWFRTRELENWIADLHKSNMLLKGAFPSVYSEETYLYLLDCGLKLLEGNERAQFRFLYDRAYSGAGRRNGLIDLWHLDRTRSLAAVAIEQKMSSAMLSNYFLPKIEQLRAQDDDPALLADHLIDLSHWLLRNDKHAINDGRIEQLLNEALTNAQERAQEMMCGAGLVRLYDSQGKLENAISTLRGMRDEYYNGGWWTSGLTVEFEKWLSALYLKSGNLEMSQKVEKGLSYFCLHGFDYNGLDRLRKELNY